MTVSRSDTGVPGTPPAHPGTPGPSVPGTGRYVIPVRHSPAAVPESSGTTPDGGFRFDPTLGRRIAPAWYAVVALLSDGRWHHWRACVDVMFSASDIKVKTCSSVLHYAVRDGLLDKTGAWARGDDRRHLRLPHEEEPA